MRCKSLVSADKCALRHSSITTCQMLNHPTKKTVQIPKVTVKISKSKTMMLNSSSSCLSIDIIRSQLTKRPKTAERSILIASFTLLLLFSVVAFMPSQSQCNPLNVQLLQQVAKPLLPLKPKLPPIKRAEEGEGGDDFMRLDGSEAFVNRNTSSPDVNRRDMRNTDSTSLVKQIKRTKFGQSFVKRFKVNSEDQLRSNLRREIMNNLESITVTNSSASSNGRLDINNNNTNEPNPALNNDINNNNIIHSTDHQIQTPAWNRNVNSVNGTIDLSRYDNSDVDRLYGDALLVYLKNFNETMPPRKETININGSQVPVYRSM